MLTDLLTYGLALGIGISGQIGDGPEGPGVSWGGRVLRVDVGGAEH